MTSVNAPFDPATPLRHLIRLALAVCRLGGPMLPPPRPGRPVEFPERAIAAMILVAVAKRLTTKSAQFRDLAAHAGALAERLGLGRFPARSTSFERHRTASARLAEALSAHARHSAERGRVDVRCVAADKTLIAAAGRPWHKSQKARGERPAAGRRRGGLVAVGARRLGLRLRRRGHRLGAAHRPDLAARASNPPPSTARPAPVRAPRSSS